MAEMFGNATAYDKYMGRWSARLAERFVRFAGVREVAKLLDVGCGTGNLIDAVEAITRATEIHGIDLSPAFVEYTRARFPAARISIQAGSALELPFADGCFDMALSQLVFQLLPNPETAAHEIRRVTRSGGTVAVCTWLDHGLEMRDMLWEEAVKFDPGASAMVERPRHCNQEGQLAGLWRAVGLTNIEESTLSLQTDFRSFDDFWLPYLNGVGPTGAYVANLTPEGREDLRAALRKRLLGDGPDQPFVLAARSLAVRGVVP